MALRASSGTATARIDSVGLASPNEEGIEKGEAALLGKQLHLEFGELPAEIRTLLSGAQLPDLGRWAERVLSAGSLAQVFDEPT